MSYGNYGGYEPVCCCEDADEHHGSACADRFRAWREQQRGRDKPQQPPTEPNKHEG